jgi:hypothetical protein
MHETKPKFRRNVAQKDPMQIELPKLAAASQDSKMVLTFFSILN